MLVLSLGVGTTVIQVIGWATMIPTQLAETGSITEAVENTFDGNHACPMCEIAAAKREVETEDPASPDQPQPDKKKAKSAYTLCSFSSFPVYTPERSSFSFPENSPYLSGQSASPDTPPPQLLS